MPLYEGLSKYHRSITTNSEEAREYFDQGPALYYGFNHEAASPFFKKALPAANLLRKGMPGAGHLVHMPSHIDIRLGNYEDAIVANEKAIIADSIWAPAGGTYTIYRAHNYHFLACAAMFDGQRGLSLSASNSIIDQVALELVRVYPDFLDGFMAVPTHVMVRFGMWEELMKHLVF